MEKNEYRVMHHIEHSYWWFVGKQFLVKTILKAFSFDGSRHEKILDIGCGTGIILKVLESFGLAYGMELSWEAIRFLRQRDLNLIARSDANQCLPFKNNTFSAITCLDVLEHVDRDITLLKEMVRVCKPMGYIVVTVPAFDILWSPHDVALHHKRRYTRKQMLENISRLSCTVIKASYYNTILFLPILAVRKLKPFFSRNKHAQSDFFMTLPNWLNTAMTLLFAAEIYCLRFFSFPFGVSLLLVLQKLDVDQTETGAR